RSFEKNESTNDEKSSIASLRPHLTNSHLGHLKHKPQHELDHAAAWIICAGGAYIPISIHNLAKLAVDCLRIHFIACAAEQKVNVVECVQKLSAEFDAFALTNASLLDHAQIPALLPRPVIEDAVTEFSRLGLRSNVRLCPVELRECAAPDFES